MEIWDSVYLCMIVQLISDETYLTVTSENLENEDEQRSFTNSRPFQDSTSFINVERTSTTVARAGKRQQSFDQIGSLNVSCHVIKTSLVPGLYESKCKVLAT